MAFLSQMSMHSSFSAWLGTILESQVVMATPSPMRVGATLRLVPGTSPDMSTSSAIATSGRTMCDTVMAPCAAISSCTVAAPTTVFGWSVSLTARLRTSSADRNAPMRLSRAFPNAMVLSPSRCPFRMRGLVTVKNRESGTAASPTLTPIASASSLLDAPMSIYMASCGTALSDGLPSMAKGKAVVMTPLTSPLRVSTRTF